MECNRGWLQPLLAQISSDRSIVAIPTVDTISSSDMGYTYNKQVSINGFRWSLVFNWYVSFIEMKKAIWVQGMCSIFSM